MDIHVEHVIHASVADVAKIMFDPTKETAWVGNTREVEVTPPGPIAVGSKIRRDGGYLAGSVDWVSEVAAYEPERLLVMNVLERHAGGVLTYEVRPTAGGTIAIVKAESHNHIPVGWVIKSEINDNLVRLANLVTHPHG
jgi:hypothetical protein